MKDKLLKFTANHYLLIGLILVFSFIVSTSTSYAKYLIQSTQSSEHVGQSACFKLTLTEDISIRLDNAIPMSDEDASSLSPYTFTIKNVCNHEAGFSVTLEQLNESDIDLRFIKYSLNNSKSSVLGNITSNESVVLENAKDSKSITTGVLGYNESKTYDLRLWLDENATNEDVGNKKFISKIVVISTLVKNTVNFDARGGNIDFNKGVIVDNRVFDLPTPTKEGYLFDGWYTKDGSGQRVDENTLVSPNTTLYARWERNEFYISYDLGGGEVSFENPTKFSTESNFVLTNPTKGGYMFTGWIEKIQQLIWYEGYINYQNGAIYENSEYPGALYSNLISLRKGESVSITETSDYPISEVRMRVYQTDGTWWYYGGEDTFTADKDCLIRVVLLRSATEAQKQSITVQIAGKKDTLAITPGTRGNRRVTATYEKDESFAISYNLDGGTVSSANPVRYTIDDEFTLNNPTKPGYTFAGWEEQVVNINWHNGFISYSDGKPREDATYPDASYSDFYPIKKGHAYKVRNLSSYSGGNVRIRVYDANKSYVGNGGNESYTATQGGYIRILLVTAASDSIKSKMTFDDRTTQQTVTINKGSAGDRVYTATYTEN